MLPSSYRPNLFTREYLSPGRDTSMRSPPASSYRAQPQININTSPRQYSDRDNSIMQFGERMRMMKSKIGNLSINSRNGLNQNNLYPTELIFLLSNEENNVEKMRRVIEDQKKRVNRDFDNFSKEIIHLIEDLKLSFHSQLDFVFRDFINIYGNMKNQVVRMKQNRRHIMETNNFGDMERPISRNPTNMNVTTSNLNLLQQISRDEQYFKHHRAYQQVTNAYFEAIGPIMTNAQNLIEIGSQLQFYQDEKCNQILNNIRDSFFNNTRQIFENQLDNLVMQTKQILQNNNMLLKDLNIEEPKNQRSNYNINHASQDKYRPNYNNGYANGNTNTNSNMNFNANKKKRVETQANHPYGFQPPTFKNNFYTQQNERSRGLRPSSSTDNMKYKSRPQSQWSSKKGGIDPSPQRYTVNTNYAYPTSNRSNKIRCSKDGLNAIADSGQYLQLNKINSIFCQQPQSILLCLTFINQGKHIAVGSKDKSIYIYLTNNGKFLHKLVGHQASICSLNNFHSFLASGGDNGCSSLILWDTQAWKMKKKVNFHSAALTCILDLQDGTNLATGGYDKRIYIYNYKRGDKIYQSNTCKSGVTSLVLCQQSKKLVSSALDSTLNIWSLFFNRNGQAESFSLDRIVTNCGMVCSLRSLALAPDIVIVGNKQGKLLVLNIYNGQISRSLAVGKSSVIQLTAIQRQSKPHNPFILTCSSGQRDLMLTKTDSGLHESTRIPISILYGCGIGPKVVVDQSGTIAVINQSQIQKQVSLYTLQIN